MNARAADRSHENYHLDSFLIPDKRRMGNVPHKSPENNAHVSPELGLLNLTMEDFFADDISMDMFINAIKG